MSLKPKFLVICLLAGSVFPGQLCADTLASAQKTVTKTVKGVTHTAGDAIGSAQKYVGKTAKGAKATTMRTVKGVTHTAGDAIGSAQKYVGKTAKGAKATTMRTVKRAGGAVEAQSSTAKRFFRTSRHAVSDAGTTAYKAGTRVARQGYAKASSTLGPKMPFGTARARTSTSFRSGMKTGLIADVAITASMAVYEQMRNGSTFDEGLDVALSYMASPVFLVGDLMGGVLGAALGASIPLPAALAAKGFLGTVLGRVPTLAGAMIFANVGATAVQLLQEGNFSWGKLFSEVDFPRIAGQAMGAAIGSTLGTMFIPVPFVGPLIGGVLGGMLGSQVVTWITGTEATPYMAATTTAKASVVGELPEEAVGTMNGHDPAALEGTEDIDEAYANFTTAYGLFLHAPEGAAKLEALDAFREAKVQYMSLIRLSEGLAAQAQ